MNRAVTEPSKQCSALGERVRTKARSCSVTLVRMIDDFAKGYLHADLRWVRRSLLFKLEELSEYDVRRPLTKTGTNLLGLIKHLNLTEERDEPGGPCTRFARSGSHAASLPSLRGKDQESEKVHTLRS